MALDISMPENQTAMIAIPRRHRLCQLPNVAYFVVTTYVGMAKTIRYNDSMILIMCLVFGSIVPSAPRSAVLTALEPYDAHYRV